MTTITLNCAYIDWVEIERTDLEVWYTNRFGDKDFVTLTKYDCELASANENLHELVQDLEQNIGDLLPEADRLYLEQKLWDTIERWSLDDDGIYC